MSKSTEQKTTITTTTTKVRVTEYREEIEKNHTKCSTKIKGTETKKEQLRDMQDRRKWSNMCFIGVPEVGNRVGRGNSQSDNGGQFSKLIKDMKFDFQEDAINHKQNKNKCITGYMVRKLQYTRHK